MKYLHPNFTQKTICKTHWHSRPTSESLPSIKKESSLIKFSSSPTSFRIHLLFIFLAFGTTSFAQLHMKVGYSAGYYQATENNKLLQTFNESNPWLEKKYDDVNWKHGLDVGLKYRLGFVAIEASWNASFTKTSAEGTSPSTNLAFNEKFLYRYNKYSLGLENFIGQFGFGGSFDYNRINMITKSSSAKTDLLKSDQWSGTLFIGFYTEHKNGISFGLRPYIQLPLSQFEITELAAHLGEPTNEPLLEKEYMVFGISLVIFNGF